MAVKLNLLQVALAEQNYDLAAHALVYGMVKVKAEQNDKKRRTKGQPKRS